MQHWTGSAICCAPFWQPAGTNSLHPGQTEQERGPSNLFGNEWASRTLQGWHSASIPSPVLEECLMFCWIKQVVVSELLKEHTHTHTLLVPVPSVSFLAQGLCYRIPFLSPVFPVLHLSPILLPGSSAIILERQPISFTPTFSFLHCSKLLSAFPSSFHNLCSPFFLLISPLSCPTFLLRGRPCPLPPAAGLTTAGALLTVPSSPLLSWSPLPFMVPESWSLPPL